MNSKPLLMALIALLSLSSCLTPSSGSPTPAIAAVGAPVDQLDPAPEGDGEVESPAPTPTPLPVVVVPEQLSLNKLSGKSFAYNTNSVAFGSGYIEDTRCGSRWNIVSSSMSDSELVIETEVDVSRYVYPGHIDCYIHLNDQMRSFVHANGICFGPASWDDNQEIAWQIQYRITEHAAGISVERTLRSRNWVASCNSYPRIYFRDEQEMPAEVYDAL